MCVEDNETRYLHRHRHHGRHYQQQLHRQQAKSLCPLHHCHYHHRHRPHHRHSQHHIISGNGKSVPVCTISAVLCLWKEHKNHVLQWVPEWIPKVPQAASGTLIPLSPAVLLSLHLICRARRQLPSMPGLRCLGLSVWACAASKHANEHRQRDRRLARTRRTDKKTSFSTSS